MTMAFLAVASIAAGFRTSPARARGSGSRKAPRRGRGRSATMAPKVKELHRTVPANAREARAPSGSADNYRERTKVRAEELHELGVRDGLLPELDDALDGSRHERRASGSR